MKHVNLPLLIETAEMILDNGKGDVTDRFARVVGGVVKFSHGTYSLRAGGVVGSCTAGGDGVLKSWLRAARKRRGKLAGKAGA